jgi:hypothetical protein
MPCQDFSNFRATFLGGGRPGARAGGPLLGSSLTRGGVRAGFFLAGGGVRLAANGACREVAIPRLEGPDVVFVGRPRSLVGPLVGGVERERRRRRRRRRREKTGGEGIYNFSSG